MKIIPNFEQNGIYCLIDPGIRCGASSKHPLLLRATRRLYPQCYLPIDGQSIANSIAHQYQLMYYWCVYVCEGKYPHTPTHTSNPLVGTD